MKKKPVKKKTDKLVFPRGEDPESMQQQDHLLVDTMARLLEEILDLSPNEIMYVTYSSGHMPSVNLHVVVHNLESTQLSLLHSLQSPPGYNPEDKWPRIEVNLYSGHIDHEKGDFVEYNGAFEVEISVYYTENRWNEIVADNHELVPAKRKKK